MRILIYFGHPSQYLFLRGTIKHFAQNKSNKIFILIKTKDVLEDIIKSDGLYYKNILPVQRGNSKASIIFSFIKRLLIIIPIIIKIRPHLMIGTDATIAIIGKLFRIHRITITEDDYEVIKHLANLTYPFTEIILCPKICNVGKYNFKKIGYDGFMKLGYLHPSIFKPDYSYLSKYNIPKNFILLRLVRLAAHHDFGITGITYEIMDEMINFIKERGVSIFISTEKALHVKYNSYLLKINPSDLHHILSYATMLISDSQSMSVEAAMLGVPSIRISSFKGKISVLEELENKYKLTFGIDPMNRTTILEKLKELLYYENLRNTFQLRQQRMLADKIDVTSFLIWFIEKYPESIKIMRENPGYQHRFKGNDVIYEL